MLIRTADAVVGVSSNIGDDGGENPAFNVLQGRLRLLDQENARLTSNLCAHVKGESVMRTINEAKAASAAAAAAAAAALSVPLFRLAAPPSLEPDAPSSSTGRAAVEARRNTPHASDDDPTRANARAAISAKTPLFVAAQLGGKSALLERIALSALPLSPLQSPIAIILRSPLASGVAADLSALGFPPPPPPPSGWRWRTPELDAPVGAAVRRAPPYAPLSPSASRARHWLARRRDLAEKGTSSASSSSSYPRFLASAQTDMPGHLLSQ